MTTNTIRLIAGLFIMVAYACGGADVLPQDPKKPSQDSTHIKPPPRNDSTQTKPPTPNDSTQTKPPIHNDSTPQTPPTVPVVGCVAKGKFQTNICGQGYWGAYLIVLPDGTALQPWDIPATTRTEGIRVEQGRDVQLTYEIVQRDNRYDTQRVCMAVPLISYDKIKPIRITCLSQ